MILFLPIFATYMNATSINCPSPSLGKFEKGNAPTAQNMTWRAIGKLMKNSKMLFVSLLIQHFINSLRENPA